MTIEGQFKEALLESFALVGIKPVIEFQKKGKIFLEVLFKVEGNIYKESFDFVEVECFLRNRWFIDAFTKRVSEKLYYTL